MELLHDVRELTLSAGADLFGVTNLAPARDAILKQGGEAVARFPRAVAIGIALPDSIVDLLTQRMNVSVAERYKLVYDETNQTLDRIASHVVDRLQAAGAQASAVPASHTVDPGRCYGVFSHKIAAHLAGLGWIGRSCLLITPEVGPRVRWATVLTDAQLSAAGRPTEQDCGECRQCVDMCPAGAFTGRAFRAAEHRDIRFDTGKCRDYTTEMSQKMGCPVLCGVCVSVCPYGKARDTQNNAMHSDGISAALHSRR